MLAIEKILPEQIAYDRPSEKLLKFLNKYFNLKDFIPQNNNYVLFNEFFLKKMSTNKKKNFNEEIDLSCRNNKENKNINYAKDSYINYLEKDTIQGKV